MDAADSRLYNDQIRAQKSLLGSNQAASASQRTVTKRSKLAGPPVGANDHLSGLVNTPQPIQQMMRPPTGSANPVPPSNFQPLYKQAPSIQPAATQQFDPQVKGMLDAIHADNLVNSPDMAAAYTKVKLRDYFHGKNSGENVGRQVLEILNSNGPKRE